MLYEQSRTAYQAAAVNGATQAGLLQLVYLRLAKDLLQAAEAVRQKNIEARCVASNHALLLLGHLESWTEELGDPSLADSLRVFYGMLRTSVLQIQATLNANRFESCAQLVLEVRLSWQIKEDDLASSICNTVAATTPESGAISVVA